MSDTPLILGVGVPVWSKEDATEENLNSLEIGEQVWLHKDHADPRGIFTHDLKEGAILQAVALDHSQPPEWALWERVR